MAQVVQTVYEAVVDQYLRGVEQVRASVRGLTQEEARQQKETDKGAVTMQQAARRRMEAIRQEQALLKQLLEERRKAFTVRDIEEFNRRIEQSKRNIATLKGQVGGLTSVMGGLKGSLLAVGGTLAAAFSAENIIQFGRAAIQSFAEQERAVNRLRFAIVELGREGEQQFRRLVAQAERMQNTTVFSDDQVLQAQAALSAFGLTAVQIEELLPRLADFATLLGTDLVTAAEKVAMGIQGSGREFKRFGIDVSASNTEIENLRLIMEGLGRQAGVAASDLETVSGQMQRMRNLTDDLREAIGEKLSGAFTRAESSMTKFFASIVLGRQKVEEGEIVRRVEEQVRTRIDAIRREKKAVEEQIEAIRELIRVRELDIEKIVAQAGAAVKKDVEDLPNVKAARMAIQLLSEQIDRLKELQQQEEKVLKVNDLKLLSTERLNELLRQQQQDATIIGQTNVRLIQAELNEREKLRQQQQKQRQELIKEEEKLLQQISQLRIQLTDDERERLKLQVDMQKEALQEREEDLRSNAEIEAAITEKKNELRLLLEQKLQHELDKINRKEFDELVKRLERETDRQAEELEKQLKERLRIQKETRERDMTVAIEHGNLERIKELLRQQLEERLQTIEATTENEQDAANKRWQAWREYYQRLNEAEDEINEKRRRNIEETTEFLTTVTRHAFDVLSQLNEQRIAGLEEQQERNRQVLDREVEQLQMQRDRQLITEQEYEQRLAEVRQKRVDTEQDIQKKIRDIQRRQAQAERILKIFEMTINLAAALLKIKAQLGIFAAAAIAAAVTFGMTQINMVKNLPLPQLARGTRRKQKSGLAVVGEKGAEVVYLPQDSLVLPAERSRRYRQALEAMFDDRFDDFVQKAYVLPAMLKLRQQRAATQQKVMVDEHTMIRALWQGTFVKNADEIGRAVARNLPKPDYRMK
jgi:hypothetical protein